MKITIQLLSFILLFALNSANAQNDKPRIYKEPKYINDWNKATVHPDRIALNITENPEKSMSVAWRTSTDVKVAYAEIAKATAAPKFWRNANTLKAETETLDLRDVPQSGQIANFHSVTFNDLEPNTMYGYRVGDGEHWSEWFQFTTAKNDDSKFSFLYVGDAQNYILELWARLIRQGYKSNPDASFIIHAGDLINHANSDRQWNEWFEAGGFIHSMLPSLPVPGNHEYRSLIKGNPRKLSLYWKPQFNLPLNGPKGLEETVYYVDYQNTRFIGLNTNENINQQVEWLENTLKNNPKKWTVVTYHHPLYSASAGRDNEELRKVLKPIFDKYKVDIVLQGHDHSYARGRVAPTEYNMVSGVNKRDQTGTVYVVSVSGGKMYSLRPNAWEGWDADRERAAENTQLIQSITIDNDTLSYQSITATGELYDAFQIIKNENGPNTFVEQKNDAIAARRHNNTIPYQDELPLELKTKVMNKYKGFKITRSSLVEENNNLIYKLRLYNDKKERKGITITENGVITEMK